MTDNTPVDSDRRQKPDRRRAPRGGRRDFDVPGRYPPVLVAESDNGARQPFVRYLERFGFQVEQATTGDAASAILATCNPQVAIAELTLPHDEEFQARIWSRGIPYIATAATDIDMVPPECAAILIKPFPLASLLKEVRRVLTLSDRAARGVVGPEWLPGQT
jgi:DNA-binding response OmpR family regulator